MGSTFGALTGLGQGLQSFGSDIGQASIEAAEIRGLRREKTVEEIASKIKPLGQNIQKLGGAHIDSATKILVPNDPNNQELASSVSAFNGLIKQHNSLFGPHEAGLLMKSIAKITGHTAKQKSATNQWTAEGEYAAVPLEKPEEDKELKGFQDDVALAMQGGASRPAAIKLALQKRKLAPEDHEASPAPNEDDQIQAAAKMWAENGIKPPAKNLLAVESYMSKNGLKPLGPKDNTPQGRLAKTLLDSGEAKNQEEANQQAAKTMMAAEQAKTKAVEAGQTQTMTREEAAALAKSDILLGRTTAFGLGKSADCSLYNKEKAQLLTGGGLGDIIGEKSNVKALQSAVGTIVRMRGQVAGFEDTLEKNLDQVIATSNKVDRSGSSLANNYLLNIQGKLEDYPELSAFKVAVNTAATEYGRITYSATGGGVNSESAREDALGLLNTALAQGALESTVQQMRTDAKNRIAGMDDTLSGLQESLKDVGNAPAKTPADFKKNAPPKDQGSPKTGVSLAKAKALPQNNGKSDDEIRQDIQAHGHTVLP